MAKKKLKKPHRTSQLYHDAIKRATKCADTEVWIVEQAMRENHRTLDAMHPDDFTYVAVDMYNAIKAAK